MPLALLYIPLSMGILLLVTFIVGRQAGCMRHKNKKSYAMVKIRKLKVFQETDIFLFF